MKTKRMSDTEYDLLADAYEGSGGFLDGMFLKRHKRETDDNYTVRRQLSFYLNYTKVVVNSHVNAVFQNEPERNYKTDPLFITFINDADGQGTSFNRWMKRTALQAKLNGCMLIVVDNFIDQPATLQGAIENRILPYVYAISPKRIVDWEQDNVGRLISISYTETRKDDKGKDETVKRKWTATNCQLLSLKDVVISSVGHTLGVLPCFLLYGSDVDPAQVIPISEFLQVARANQAIFNLCSEIRELQRHQGFNVLTIQGNEPTNKKKTLGSDNALYYDANVSNAPNFIAPNPSPLERLEMFMDRLIGEIYRMSCITHTQQYAAANQSGESKKWTFQITRQVLNDFAANCEYAEMRIALLFGKYITTDLQMVVNYNRKYGVENIDDDLIQAQAALDLDLGAEGNAEVRKRAARQYFAEYEDDDIERIVESIELDKKEKESNNNADKKINDLITTLPNGGDE